MSNTAQTSAMDRINLLLDENSFVEIGANVTKRSTDFNLQEKSVPGDGVITGYGVIDGNLVYVYSQDSSSLGGSMGEMHAKKIARIYDMALKMGAPVVGLVDCAGLRLQEATDALAGFGELYLKQTLASGVVPQITAVFGTCGGGSAVSALLGDFTFMAESGSKLFVNAPNTIAGNYVEKCDTSSAKFQSEAGTADFVEADEQTVLTKVRELVGILPANNEDDASYDECSDDLNRPSYDAGSKDSAKALADLSDNNFFMEVKKDYAKDMVAGFIRLNGMTVGAVANRSEIQDENGKVTQKMEARLSAEGCVKAADFVSFCDAFDIPVLTLTNVEGYMATACSEKTMAKAAAKLTYAFANASVPKVNVVTGKAFGSAYLAMNSKHIGADMVFALDGSQIGTMDAKEAVKIIYADEVKDSDAVLNEKANEYKKLQSSAESAAQRGYVDAVIEAADTRKNIIYAYEMLFTKRENRPAKKHGTV